MSERKFARGLGKPGTAAQLRETVSQVVKENTVLVSRNVKTQPKNHYFFVLFCASRETHHTIFSLYVHLKLTVAID
jgi:hypothetical protein